MLPPLARPEPSPSQWAASVAVILSALSPRGLLRDIGFLILAIASLVASRMLAMPVAGLLP